MAKLEETFRLYVEAQGEGDIKKMTKAFDELESGLADAGPEAQALLGELRKLTTLGAQVNGLTKLKGEIYDTGNALALAKIRTRELENEFANTLEPSKRLTRELERSRKAVADLTAQENRQNAELQRTQNAMRAAGLSTDKLGQAQQTVRDRIQATTTELRKYATTAGTAEQSTGKLGGVFTSLRGALAALGITVGLRAALDGVKNLLSLGDAAEKARIQLATLYGSQREGDEAFERLRNLARQNGQEFDAVREAAVKLKAVGLDPLDGTLQALIDQSAKLGGSQETLTSIGLALGQMWSKQKIQTEEILQLVERGVPAFDLLAKVTGKQGAELTKLIESGKLGRETIRGLIDEIGRSTAGAAAANLNTLSGLVAQLRDRVRAFFTDVSDSGPLNFFKTQLRGLIDQFDRLARSGALEEWARKAGSAITTVATAIAGTARFVVDYSAALVGLARAYALVKVSNFVAGLALAASRATKATTAVQLLSAAILKIPFVRVLVIGGAAIAAAKDGIDALSNAMADNLPVSRRLAEQQAALRKELEGQAEGYRAAAEKLAKFADTQVINADAAAKLSEAERQAQRERTEGLERYLQMQVRYYETLRALNQLNDEGAAALEQYKTRLKDVSTGLDALDAGARQAADAIAKGITVAALQARKELAGIGDSSDVAKKKLGEVLKDFDAVSFTKLGDVALAVQSIGEESDGAATKVKAGLGEELKKLSGADLQRFQMAATAAFDEVGRSGERTAVVLDATLQTALERLKVDAGRTGEAFTKAGKDILATFDVVVTNAQASGAQIAEAFRVALGGVKTIEEAEALGNALKAATDKGTIGAQATERAMIQLKARIRELKAETDPLADSFDQLGIKSQRALDAARDAAREAFTAIVDGAREGAAAQGDIVRAFEALAAAERQAVAQGTASEQARVESLLAAKAAALGLSTELERAGVIGKQAGDETADAMRGARDAITDTAAAAGEMAAQQTRVVEQVQATNNQIIIQTQLTDAQRRALLYLGQEWDAGRVSAEDYGTTLQDIMAGGTEAIERQIEAAERARDALRDLTDQLRDEADRALGNEAEIERRRYQEQLDRIKELEEAGGAAARREAMEARRLAEEEHRRRLAEIREQAQARREADAPASSGGGSSAGGGGGDSRPAAAPTIPMNFNMRIDGGVFASNKSELARLLEAEFQAMFKNGGFLYNQVQTIVRQANAGGRRL